LNGDKEMQNVHVEALIVTNCCGLSLLVKPDKARPALCSSQLINKSIIIEREINILGSTRSTVDDSPPQNKIK
jgi:hypothetical protein